MSFIRLLFNCFSIMFSEHGAVSTDENAQLEKYLEIINNSPDITEDFYAYVIKRFANITDYKLICTIPAKKTRSIFHRSLIEITSIKAAKN